MKKKQSDSLKNYILHLDNWIPKNILDKTIVELSEDKNWKQHNFTNSQTLKNIALNGDKELNVSNGLKLTHLQDLHDLTWKALEKYILLDKISGETFNAWKGFSQIRFNRYNNNQIMSKHCDLIVSLFTGDIRGIPVLSIVAVLNDNYEGGEFIMFDDYEI